MCLVCVCLHREQALLTARREPILSRERVYERIRYPNVYDSYAEAAKTPAFVGGAKVRLPKEKFNQNLIICGIIEFLLWDLLHRFN